MLFVAQMSNFLDCQIYLTVYPVSLFFPAQYRALLTTLYLADIVLPRQASASTFVKIAIKINQTFTVPVELTLTIENYTSGVARELQRLRSRTF